MHSLSMVAGHSRFVALAGTLALVSCGGGNGSSPAAVTQTTYAISVTASGLTGTIVLQDNGGDNLSISADGSATFPTKLAPGSTYQVTVLSPLANEACTVAHGSGTIASAPVQNITVTCRPGVTLSVPQSGASVRADPYTVVFPANALSTSGAVTVAAWVSSDPTIAQRFDDGTAAFGPNVTAESQEFQITLDSTATPTGFVAVTMPLSSMLLSQLSTNSSLTPLAFYLLPYVSDDPDVDESIDTFEPAASSFASGTITAQIPSAAFAQNSDGSYTAVVKLGLALQIPTIALPAAAANTGSPVHVDRAAALAAATCSSSPIANDGSGGSFSNPLNAQLEIVGPYAETHGHAGNFHAGVDIATQAVPVYAVRQGYIERVLWTKSGIFYVVVRHLDGTGAAYLHLQSLSVMSGGTALPVDLQKQGGFGYRETNPCNPKYPVRRSEQIATSGNTGANSYHLHLQMMKAINTSNYATPQPVQFSTSVNPILRLGTLTATFLSSGTTAANLSGGSTDTAQLYFQDHQTQPQEILIRRRKPSSFASTVARSAEFDAPLSNWPALKVSWTQASAGVTLESFDSSPPYLVASPWGIQYDNGQARVAATAAPYSATYTVTVEAVHLADGSVNPPNILSTETSAGEVPQAVTLTVGSKACTALAGNLSLVQGTGGALYKPVLDNTNVYWFEFDGTQGFTGGSIRTIPKSGGQVTVLASGLGGVNDIAADNSNVYWSEYDIATNGSNSSVKSAPKTGGAVTTLASGTPPPPGSTFDVHPYGITFDSGYVYWGDTAGGGAIRRVSKAGGQIVDFGRGQGAVGWLALDAASTFFYYSSGEGFSRLPFNGGTAQTLATNVGQNIFGGIALDSNFVYWVDLTSGPPPGGTVFEIPIGGGPPNYLVIGLLDPHNLAIDNSYVYYPTTPGNNPGLPAVARVSKSGGTPTAYPNCISSVIGGPWEVAVDGTDVYVIGSAPNAQGNPPTIGVLAKFPK